VPEFGVFDLPFFFKDRAAVKRAVDGPFGQELARLAEAKGLVILGYWENGFRQITNARRPIRVPDDLRGLKIRTPPNPDRVKMFNDWGANAAPLDFSELFSALQTGVFDGQENPMAQITSAKLYEVQKYLSFSGHVYTPTYLAASKTWIEGLEPGTQRILRELAVHVGDASRERGEKFDDEGERSVRQAGMEVNKDVDKEAFRRTAEALYSDYRLVRCGDPVRRSERFGHLASGQVAAGLPRLERDGGFKQTDVDVLSLAGALPDVEGG
jgi:tripartite ATP-independent transporter DctP family solute receptor